MVKGENVKKPNLTAMFAVAIMLILLVPTFMPSARATQPPVYTTTLYVGHNDIGYGGPSPHIRNLKLTNFNQLSEETPWGVNAVQASRVHRLTKGQGVNVAVIDAGFDFQHTELVNNFMGGYDFVDNDDTPEPIDNNYHGTMVAGVIAARDNNYGIVGVAPRVNLYLLKADNPERDVLAINWAIGHDINIICMSFVAVNNTSLYDSLTNAWDNGILLVASVANDVSEDPPDIYPLPWSHPDVIAVTNLASVPLTYTGPKVELSAPGENIKSTTLGDGFRVGSGTSYAAPHVAGVAALLWSMDPFLTNGQVRDILFKTARDLGDPGWDDTYGYGLVDALAAVNFIAHMPVRADPVAAYDAASRELIFNVYDTLITYYGEKYWEFAPGLADEWTGRMDVTKDISSYNVSLWNPAGSTWSDGSTCLGWADIYPDGLLSGGDVLYMLEPDGSVRTWTVQRVGWGGVVWLTLWRGYYDFHLREADIKFFDEGGNIVGVFDIGDVEYSFERGLVQDQYGSPMWMFYDLLFYQMSSDWWDTGNPEDAWTLSRLIDCSFEIVSQSPPIFRINVGHPVFDDVFYQILTQTWSSIVDREFSINIGCWNGDLYTDANGNGYPDWFETGSTTVTWWRHKWRSPYDQTAPITRPPGVDFTNGYRYVGTGPYHVQVFNEENRIVVLSYNPEHWRGWPAPGHTDFLEQIVICYISDWYLMRDAFIDGELDIADIPKPFMYDHNLLKSPYPPFEPVWPDIKVIPNKPTWDFAYFKWLKYWVRGWCYNLYYPSDYYYSLLKLQTCWYDISGPIQGVPDSVVNMRDIVYLILHFNAKAPELDPKDLRWIGTYGWGGVDPYPDRKCDFRDIMHAILHFGNTTQP
jgi:subtilisin/minor extracellular protease Epr